MQLSDLLPYNPITIQCHDNPDADTIGAGYGVYCYFRSKGKDVRMIYSGANRIRKANLKILIEQLNIPIEYLDPRENRQLEGLLITVDCQFGSGNVTAIKADELAIIDHHPLECKEMDHCRIQTGIGSCTTLVWIMLLEEHYPVNGDMNLGTALYYGLYTDTNQFSELFNPLDMDMRESLAYNKNLVTRLRNSNLSLKELEIAGIAMIRYNYNEDHHFAVIRAQPCDPNILGLISDFLLQVDEIHTCVVYNEINDGFKLSVRSCIREVNANELAVFLTQDIGSGGGHYEKAGGFISSRRYMKKYPMLHSEAYFNNRMSQYFESFSIIHALEEKIDISTMKQYRRTLAPLCCVRLTELVEHGAHVSIRTQKGNMDFIVEEDTYLAMERDGTLHAMSSERFHKYFTMTKHGITDDYYEDIAYMPAVKDWTNGNSFQLVDYARFALPGDSFRIYAAKLDKCVKVFPQWDQNRYMLGMPGDYLAVSVDDLHNIFIEPGEGFWKNFEEVDEEMAISMA